jgi:hypothetical protein
MYLIFLDIEFEMRVYGCIGLWLKGSRGSDLILQIGVVNFTLCFQLGLVEILVSRNALIY